MMMHRIWKAVNRRHTDYERRIAALSVQSERSLLLNARQAARRLIDCPDGMQFDNVEFSVYSQAGDDGIIQYILTHMDGKIPDRCIELGCSDYLESNTRFLVWNDNWSALVIDGSEENICAIKSQNIMASRDILPVCSFITVENINSIISNSNTGADIGLMHIDIEGNNYWVWRAITCVIPTIVSVEYNSVFGPDRSISVPYNPTFNRFTAHYSGLYFSASLQALRDLAGEKGYVFIGSNSYGTTAYFVLRGYEEHFHVPGPGEGYVRSKFRESRDESSALTFLREEDRYRLIAGLPVVNTRTGAVETL